MLDNVFIKVICRKCSFHTPLPPQYVRLIFAYSHSPAFPRFSALLASDVNFLTTFFSICFEMVRKQKKYYVLPGTWFQGGIIPNVPPNFWEGGDILSHAFPQTPDFRGYISNVPLPTFRRNFRFCYAFLLIFISISPYLVIFF